MGGGAVRHAVYLLNKLPTRALSGKTPFEVWYKKKPDVSYVRVFGCLSHMKVPSSRTMKLDDPSKQVINMGKETGTKAYRLYDPKENKVYVNRDVTFEENKKWSWNQEGQGEHVEGVTFPVLNMQLGEDKDVEEEHSNTDALTPRHSPITRTSTSRLSADNYDDSVEPRKVRDLTDVYDHSEEVEIDEELYIVGLEKPTRYKQAVQEKN